MFKKLFSFKSNKDEKELLHLATQKKKEGNFDEAIQHLKEAYKVIGKGRINYDIKTLLRLPKYLQLADRSDEAWSEFNKLLSEVYSNRNDNIVIQHIDASIIRSEEHTSELQSRGHLVCRLLLEKKKNK